MSQAINKNTLNRTSATLNSNKAATITRENNNGTTTVTAAPASGGRLVENGGQNEFITGLLL